MSGKEKYYDWFCPECDGHYSITNPKVGDSVECDCGWSGSIGKLEEAFNQAFVS